MGFRGKLAGATQRLPRALGDGPAASRPTEAPIPAPPCTRGWTRRPADQASSTPGSPVHTGMDRCAATSGTVACRLPRVHAPVHRDHQDRSIVITSIAIVITWITAS